MSQEIDWRDMLFLNNFIKSIGSFLKFIYEQVGQGIIAIVSLLIISFILHLLFG